MIDFTVKGGTLLEQSTACIVVGVFQSNRLSTVARLINASSKKYLSKILKSNDITGQIGQSLLLHHVPGVVADRVLLVGCGKQADLNPRAYCRVVTSALSELKATAASDAIFCLHELSVKLSDKTTNDIYWKIRQCVEISHSMLYQFHQMKSSKNISKSSLRNITLIVSNNSHVAVGKRAVEHGLAIAKGVTLARDLANLPANMCTPSYLADQARKLSRDQKSVKTTVLNEAGMKKLGMNVLLSVSQGSRQPAKLITMQYQGAAQKHKPVVLVGKGVTFDTGGISIKPSSAMDEMKYDMCGAASVLGTIRAIATLGLPLNVVGVVPAVENMPGGQATRPGDIYTSMSGQTVEVLNTDAEGRLILCDALTYSKRFNPVAVIDIATLTGACVIALGKHATGLMTNHQPLAKDIINAGEHAHDRVWQLPLWDEYQQQLNSNFADIANIGGRDAGTITAACFLSRFTEDYHWAHLDIAGTAWLSGEKKGATGRPVPLLVQYLLNRCQ